ncbi:MAG TPA: hypothetical protein VNM22_14955 [Candidatus Limnocylindrales bacterium]|nr:hypothetical protein [Candidatus Limnocylindrales bacterium]
MKEYLIQLEEVRHGYLIIKAESADEAKRIAQERIRAGYYELDKSGGVNIIHVIEKNKSL